MRISLFAVLASSVVMPALAHAQEAETPAGSADIVVTASRRAETITTIPIAVTAVQGDTIVANDIRDLAELSASIPNFKAGNGGYLGEAIAIRGLGTGQDRSFEQAVGLYVDGVYFPRSRANRAAFFDVDRVEVMRGPQAVLQGLNSTAGAISIISKKARPGDPFSLDLSGGGEFEQGGFNAQAATSFSPAPWLGVRAAIRYGEDGAYYFNTSTGKEENKRKDFAARLTLTAALGEKTLLTIKGEHAYYFNDGSEGEAVGARSPLAAAFPDLTDNGVADWRRSTSAELHKITYLAGFTRADKPQSRLQSDGVVVDLTTEIGDGSLSVTGAYYKSSWDHELDVDATDATFLEGGNYEDYDQKSVSLQYTSPDDKPLEYVFGAYYQKGQLDFVIPNAIDPSNLTGIPLGIGYTGIFNQDSELYSAFGSATYNVSESLRLIGGLRYVHERKDVVVSSDCSWRSLSNWAAIPDSVVGIPVYAIGLCSDPGMAVPGGVRRSRTAKPVMFEGSVQYDLTPDIMSYVKYSTSAKSGGFSAATEIAPQNIEYDDEKAKGLEVGIKGRLMGGRMTFALAAFRTTFKDLQLKSDVIDPVTSQTVTVVSNAGSSRSQGIEAELRYLASDSFSLQASVGYLDGKFRRFNTAPCGVSNTPAPGSTTCDFSGRKMPFAADWTGNVGFQWRPEINSKLRAVVAPELQFSSSYTTDGTLDEGGRQGSWAKLDLRVGIEDIDQRWSVAVIGKNLTQRRIISGYQPTILLPVVFYEPPRTISLRLSYKM
jgi:outer membrane receptor protein involved in Fe transport